MIENFELVSYSRHAHNIPTALNDKIGYYDLTFVLSGELSYVIDGVPITVSDGDVILIPKGSSRIRLQGHDVCKYFSINFKSSLDSPLPVYMKACLNGEVFSFWNLIYQTAKGNSNYKESLIKDLVDALLITLKERQEKKNENRHITKIKN